MFYPLPWEPGGQSLRSGSTGLAAASALKKGIFQKRPRGGEDPQEAKVSKTVEHDLKRIPQGSQGFRAGAAPPEAIASKRFLDQNGGSDLESVQAPQGPTSGGVPPLPF